MSELLLHHFDASSYAEKVCLLLDYCGLEWASVRISRSIIGSVRMRFPRDGFVIAPPGTPSTDRE